MQVRAAHKMSLPSIFKAKKGLYNNYSPYISKDKGVLYISLTHHRVTQRVYLHSPHNAA